MLFLVTVPHIGSKEAGPRVAAIISVVETCRRLKIPSATIRAQSCPAWAIFQSAESPSSRPRHGRAETNRSRCHRVFASASRIRLIHAAKPHQCRPLRVSKARYKIHSDPISRMKPELNKANNSVAAQCPTCHATTSFDAHDASVNLQL